MARWSTRYRSKHGFDCVIELEHDDHKLLLKMADELMAKMLKSGVKPMTERPPVPIPERRKK